MECERRSDSHFQHMSSPFLSFSSFFRTATLDVSHVIFNADRVSVIYNEVRRKSSHTAGLGFSRHVNTDFRNNGHCKMDCILVKNQCIPFYDRCNSNHRLRLTVNVPVVYNSRAFQP